MVTSPIVTVCYNLSVLSILAVLKRVSRNFLIALVRIATLCDWLIEILHPCIINQSEVKPKPIMTYSHAFSRACCRLHVFALNSDWFVGLSSSVLIGQRVGQSDCFGFGFVTRK